MLNWERLRFDDDAQPPKWLNYALRSERSMDEFIGLIRGIVADGKVNKSETAFLARWVSHNREFSAMWPIRALVARLNEIYEDGVVTDEECASLGEFLIALVGNEHHPVHSTTLPLTKPFPDVIFDQNEFVFTGKFVYGTRRRCTDAVASLGGRCCEDVTLRTSYLVVGALGSRDWAHSPWGRKIERAATFRTVQIICEEHWHRYLHPFEPQPRS